MASLVQKFIVEDVSKASSILPQHVALVKPDGTPYGTSKGSKGASVSGIALVKDESGAITGGTATLTDGTAVDITVTSAAS